MAAKDPAGASGTPRFRIALSFPGEKRPFVERVATRLANSVGRDRVLYDFYYEAEFARPDLDTYLQRLYHDESELIVVFLYAEYERKEWPGLEWRAIRDVIKRRRAASVMPIRFDKTEIPGLFSTDGYIWVGDREPEAIAERILERLDDPGIIIGAAGSLLTNPTAVANPFNWWNPAVPPHFVGRRQELAKLEKSLERRNGVSIVGDSRIGKSSLLRTFALRFPGRNLALLDGLGPEGQSPAGLAEAVTGRRPKNESADSAADLLATWAANAGGLAPILLIDEFDHLPSTFEYRFFERLRHLLDVIFLVIVSRQDVDHLFKQAGKTSPLYNRLGLIRLGLLAPGDAEALLKSGDALLAADRDLILAWAGRHPYFLQLLGQKLLETRELGGSAEEAFAEGRDQVGGIFGELWQHLSTREQALLQRAARGEEVDTEKLRRRGLLTGDGRIFGELFAHWIRERG